MRVTPEKVLSLAVASTLVACFALPASLSFARHRHFQPGSRRLACDAFFADKPTLAAKAGDTLWTLTERNTGKPWVWPQIWTLNPEMTNPHVLAVGQIVHFAARPAAAATTIHSAMPTATGDELATAQSPDGSEPRSASDETTDAAAPVAPERQTPSAATLTPPSASAAAAAAMAPATTPAKERKDTAALLPAALFSRHEWQRFGTVVQSTQEGLLGQAGERLRIRWKDAAAQHAGPYAIVRAPDGWRTADDGHRTGIMATCTGIARAIDGDPQQVIVDSVREEIEVGQRVVPVAWMQEPSRATQISSQHVCGHLVGNEHVAIVGSPLHVVFFDRGSQDGLRVGDLLLGEGQGIGHAHRPMLRVLRAGDHHATLSAVSTTQELVHGQALCTATKAQADAAAPVTPSAP